MTQVYWQHIKNENNHVTRGVVEFKPIEPLEVANDWHSPQIIYTLELDGDESKEYDLESIMAYYEETFKYFDKPYTNEGFMVDGGKFKCE